ncbi:MULTISPECIES: TonB-dependent receptor [unclassified Carboxylicivirga]|uniref:TonB-dependent receptor n=1 Tax=Carboxylicivirga TaxID=1628153 RepID=UPI003D3528AA
MKLAVFFMLIGLVHASANSYSQSAKISIDLNNAELKEVIKEIQKQTEFTFFYSPEDVKEIKSIDVKVIDGKLQDILNECIKNTGLEYEIKHKAIILKKSINNSSSAEIGNNTEVQRRIITGKVTDIQGEPLPGVSIVIKGTTSGSITDIDGNYTLEVPDNAEVLVFSFIGMKTQEIVIGAQTLINILMEDEAFGLGEVVAVGYGFQKKVNLTGAVATITAEDINNRPVVSAAGALQGADPSLNLTFGSGVLDTDYNINIRGVTSINGGSPLILADGMEVNLNQINPNDIESVSVLKDASSAAIYGAKASSGVILITTKKGKDTGGVSKISYNGRMGWSKNTTSTDFINTGYDHVNIVNSFYRVYKGQDMALYSDQEMQMLYDRRNDVTENPDRPWVTVGEGGKYNYYGNFDWHKYFFRDTRPQQEHNVSASGGNEKINYFVSGRYLNQDGIFNIYEDNYNNLSFRSKIEAKLKPWLKYSNNINYNASMYKYAGFYDEQYTFRALQSNTMSSFLPRNPDGSIVQYTNQLSANSPLAAGHAGFLTANQARNSRGNKYLIISNQFDVDITKDLVLTASYAYKYRNRLYKYRNMPFEYSRRLGEYESFVSGSVYNFYQESHYYINNHNANVYATYDHSWDKHNLKAVFGSQYEDYRQTFLRAKQTDLLSDDLESFAVATGEMTLSQSINAFRTLGYFSRINYDFEGRYLVELSGRWDGTSRFSNEDRWGFFPSASAGWRVSEEGFFNSLKEVVGNLKVRASVGSLGNQQVDYYSYIDQIYTDREMSYTFDGDSKENYATVSAPISSSLTWETVTTYDIGLDVSLLNNRLSFTGDYYIRDTKDMLTESLTPPSVYGASTPRANCADLRTKGWEIYLTWNDRLTVANKPLTYNIGVTVGDYQSTITKYNNPEKLISDYYVGKTLGEIWGYSVAGLFATDEEAAAYQAEIDDRAVNNRVYNGKIDRFLLAGDVQFIDLNGDYEINEGSGTVSDPGDKRIIGNMLPRYSYSVNMGGNWNGFDLSVLFQGVGKQDWYPTQNAYNFWGPYSFPSLSFIHKDFMDNVWSEDNPNAYFPRARGYQSYSSGSLGVYNDRYLQDASYLRLKNLTLGYTLPLNKKIFDKVRVYATGENLFYWSKLKKYTKTVDPELANSTDTYDSRSGVGYAYSKSFSVGVDITF